MTAADPASLAALHAQAFAAPWSADTFADLLSQPGVLAVSEPDGFILIRTVLDEAEILTLAVDPAARRRGLARALVEAAAGAARMAGADVMFLEVAHDNLPALGLYEAAGFERAGLRRGYYDRGAAGSADAVVMRLDLGRET